MKLEEIIEEASESLGSKRVFGEPYEKNGVTIIPAARVMGGAGGGDGQAQASEATSDGPPGGRPSGSGAGFGMRASPAGAFVIKGDDVRWMPAIDVNRLMIGFQLVLIVFFLAVRSVAKSRAKARA